MMTQRMNSILKRLVLIVFTMMSMFGGYVGADGQCNHAASVYETQDAGSLTVKDNNEQAPCHQQVKNSTGTDECCCDESTCQCHHIVNMIYALYSQITSLHFAPQPPAVANSDNLHEVYIPLLKKPPIS